VSQRGLSAFKREPVEGAILRAGTVLQDRADQIVSDRLHEPSRSIISGFKCAAHPVRGSPSDRGSRFLPPSRGDTTRSTLHRDTRFIELRGGQRDRAGEEA
jgi:hypothetical protein